MTFQNKAREADFLKKIIIQSAKWTYYLFLI